jgi:hypothetical protein
MKADLDEDKAANYDFFKDYQPSKFQHSYLFLTSGDVFSFEKNGYSVDGGRLYLNGYMAGKKMANVLPWSYNVEADEKKLR